MEYINSTATDKLNYHCEALFTIIRIPLWGRGNLYACREIASPHRAKLECIYDNKQDLNLAHNDKKILLLHDERR